MSLWDDPQPEEKEKIIQKIANVIFDYEMDLVAILFLESIKPMASIGAHMGRYMVAPFIPFLGQKSIPYLATFEDRSNIEKLIKKLEDKNIKQKEEEEKRKKEKSRDKKSLWDRIFPS